MISRVVDVPRKLEEKKSAAGCTDNTKAWIVGVTDKIRQTNILYFKSF